MSYYAVVDDFRVGMPQTILPTPLRPRGKADHTTEGAEGEAGALGTIQFLIDAAARNASYHEIWYAKNGGFEARRIVRPDRAAHSMNPAQPPWAPNTRVRRILGDRWYDPNAYSYAVSIAGTTAVTVPKLVNDPGFMAGARRRNAELLAQFPSMSADPLFNHGEGQADRSDWGPLMRPALEETEVPVILRPVYEEWTTRASADGSAGYFTTDGPGQGERKWFTTPEKVRSYAETADAKYRAIAYGTETLWMERAQLTPIPGTRNPATGYGLPSVSTGYSVEQVRQYRDKVIGAYTTAGVKAATAVTP